MALTNYADLKTSVANYLGRSDLTSQIPDFITMAEFRLSRQIRTRKMLKSATTTLPSGDSRVSLPNDFLEMRDIFIRGTPRIVLNYMSPSALTRDARTEESGTSVFYSVVGAEMSFAPIPDKDYTVEMLYYYKPTALSDTVQTNPFLINYPDALLYAALAEAEPYLMNDQRIQTWAALYDRAISAINVSDENSEYSGVPLKMQVISR